MRLSPFSRQALVRCHTFDISLSQLRFNMTLLTAAMPEPRKEPQHNQRGDVRDNERSAAKCQVQPRAPAHQRPPSRSFHFRDASPYFFAETGRQRSLHLPATKSGAQFLVITGLHSGAACCHDTAQTGTLKMGRSNNPSVPGTADRNPWLRLPDSPPMLPSDILCCCNQPAGFRARPLRSRPGCHEAFH
jgi:hypothetical protein